MQHIWSKTFFMFLLPSMLSLAAGPTWSHKAASEVKWYKLTNAGTFLYGTDDGLTMLDPETGNVLWNRTDLRKIPQFNVEDVAGVPLLFVAANEGTFTQKTRLVALDITDGKTAWETEKLPGSIVDVFPAYEENAIVMVTVPYQGGKSEFDVTALDFATGKDLFQTHIDDKADLYVADSSGKFSLKFDMSGHAPAVIHEGVLYLSYAGIHALDAKTGKLLWKNTFDVTDKDFKKTNAAPVVHGDVVISSAKGILRGFDRKTGQLKWKTPDLGGGVAEMLVNGGVLFGRMGGTFMKQLTKEWELRKPLGVVAVNPETGAVLWKYDKARESITNMVLMPDGQTVLIADHKNLIGLSRDGQEVFRTEVNFKKGGGLTAGKVAAGAVKVGLGGLGALGGNDKSAQDAPVAVIPRGETGLIVVRGKQGVLSFDPRQKTIAWASVYEAPGVPGWQKIAMAAVTAMAYTYYTGQAANSYAGTSQNYWANQQRTQSIQNYNRFASKRFSATRQGQSHVYILTDIEQGKEKGPGLVGVNLDTGETDQEILLNERQPDYEVDETTGMLFRVIKKREITGTRLSS
jgi:outer membrane protein assembly factor BamB